jgi:hypothetical protein
MRNLIAAPLVLGAALVALATPAYAGTAAPHATADGWVRLANLSPSAGTCNLYLYSLSNPQALIVLHNVTYGQVSSYAALPAGDYTVDMRMANQPDTSPAVASAALMLMGNMQYTVAAMGAGTHKQVQVIDDSNSVPSGKTAVRILQAASLTTVSADVGQQQVGSDLKFGDITHYQTVAPGTQVVSLDTSDGQASAHIALTANTTHTLVVLQGAKGPQISELTDAVGTTARPAGSAATGFGGTAPRPASSPVLWLAMILAGGAAAVFGRWRSRRSGTTASR